MAARFKSPDTAFSLAPSAGQKQPRVMDDAHLKWIRTLPCILTGRRPVDACHIRYSDPKFYKRETGRGEKPDDKWVVPMCRDMHDTQHSMNERAFWARHKIDPVAVAAALFLHSGNDAAAETIFRNARAKV